MSHIMNCKNNLVQRIFLFFDMFLLCKFAINIPKNNWGVPSYFSCYRATSDRLRFSLFRKQNWQCPVATIGKFHGRSMFHYGKVCCFCMLAEKEIPIFQQCTTAM